MQRRKFMQQTLLAGGALFTSGQQVFANNRFENKPADEKPFHLNYGIHDGMFKNHAGADFIEQIKFAHSAGFRSIEDNGIGFNQAQSRNGVGITNILNRVETYCGSTLIITAPGKGCRLEVTIPLKNEE